MQPTAESRILSLENQLDVVLNSIESLRAQLRARTALLLVTFAVVAVLLALFGFQLLSRTLEIASLRICDQSGKPRIQLAVVSDTPALTFFDRTGASRAELHLVPDGPELILKDPNGTSRIEMTATRSTPRFDIFGAEDKRRCGLSLTSDGDPFLGLWDKNTLGSVGISATDRGPAIALSDSVGRNRGGLVVSNLGPTLTFDDADGRNRAYLVVAPDPSGPTLRFLNKDNEITFEIP